MTHGLHWFRRDLRFAGNPALQWNLEKHQGRTLGVFFFDETFLARPDFSANRFAFFLNALKALREELRSKGGDLLVLSGGPEEGFSNLFQKLGSKAPGTVSWNRDYEPYARARDATVTKLLEKELKVQVHTERDHLLLEPHEIGKGDGAGFYQVYSPFARRWFDALKTPEIQARIKDAFRVAVNPCLKWGEFLGGEAAAMDQLETFATKNAVSVTVPVPAAGAKAALRSLHAFGERIGNYAEGRDILAGGATSGLSIHLKNGALSIAQAIAELELSPGKFEDKSGPAVFLKELCWREFYIHILFHKPEVEKKSFLAKYEKLAWKNDKSHFEAWKAGKTGYPVVDAAMRELATTGLMHNRARMIVASFLTKHLLIDWRWGERYFMRMLLDGDMGPNNGGWQWAASTGCDPQPYFRVFNPTLQSEKFDASGEYIRRHVPELRHLKNKEIHDPPDEARAKTGYPEPIVVHSIARLRVLDVYK